MGINKVILVGNVGRDPETRALPSGSTLTKFSLATTEKRYKDQNGEPHTEWHNIVVWGRLAEIAAQYIRRGKQIYLEGRVRRRDYEKDGHKVYFTEIHCDNFELLGRRDDGDYSGGGYQDGGGGGGYQSGGGGGGSQGGGGYQSGGGGYGGGSQGGGNQGGGNQGGDNQSGGNQGGGTPSPPELPDDDDVPF